MQSIKNARAITKFFQTGHPVKYSKNELIVGSETRPQGIFFIDTGFVKVYSITNDGDKIVNIIYKHGEVFPLTWAYLGVSLDVYYEALSEVLVWRVSQEQMAAANSVTAHALACQMAEQFLLYNERTTNLLLKSSRERIIHMLVFLAGRFGVPQNGDENSIRISLPITHELIAVSVNLARESVSRELEKLERKGFVSRVNHRIIIPDLDKLNSQLNTPLNLELYE